MLRRFLSEGNHQPEGFLVRQGHSEPSCILHTRSYDILPCTRKNEDMMLSLGLDASKFFLHSLRSGGVSTALSSPGVPVRLVQRHGGWRRLDSMEGYVDETWTTCCKYRAVWDDHRLCFSGRNARRSATAAGIWTDLKCGVSEVERSLRDEECAVVCPTAAECRLAIETIKTHFYVLVEFFVLTVRDRSPGRSFVCAKCHEAIRDQRFFNK